MSWSTLKRNIDTLNSVCLTFAHARAHAHTHKHTTGGAGYPEIYPVVVMLLDSGCYVNIGTKKIAFSSKSLINQ